MATAQENDTGPVVEFLDKREPLVYGPLPEGNSVGIQLLVKGELIEPVTVTLTGTNFVSDKGQPINTDSLIQGIEPDGGRAVIEAQTNPTVTFTLHIYSFTSSSKPPLTAPPVGSYTGQLLARLGSGPPESRNVTFVIGPTKVPSLISSELVVTVQACPRLLSRIDNTIVRWIRQNICAVSETGLPITRFTNNGVALGNVEAGQIDPYYQGVAGGTAVNKTTGDNVRLELLDQGRYPPDCSQLSESETPGSLCLFRFLPRRLIDSGRYEGTFYLDSSNKASSPSVPVTILARDTYLFPLIIFLLGIWLSARLAHYLGPGLTSRKEQERKRKIIERKKEIERNARLLNQRTKFVNPNRRLYAEYFCPQQIFDDLPLTSGPELESAEKELDLRAAFLRKIDTFLLDHRDLYLDMRRFIRRNQQRLRRSRPALIAEIEGRTLKDAQIAYPLDSLSGPFTQFERLQAIKKLLPRFQATHQLLLELESDSQNTPKRSPPLTEEQHKAMKAMQEQILEAKKKLWTANTDEELEAARDALIAARLVLHRTTRSKNAGAKVRSGEQTIRLPKITHVGISVEAARRSESSDAEITSRDCNGEPVKAARDVKVNTEIGISICLTYEREPKHQYPLDLLVNFGDGVALRIVIRSGRQPAGTKLGFTVPYQYMKPGLYTIKTVAQVVGSPMPGTPGLTCVRVKSTSPLDGWSEEISTEQTKEKFWHQRIKRESWLNGILTLLWWLAGKLVRLFLRLVAFLSQPIREPMSLVRWLVVIASGFGAVYYSNPTFGSISDYLFAFLWGTTADAAVRVIGSIVESNEAIKTAFSSLFHR